VIVGADGQEHVRTNPSAKEVKSLLGL
jgi:hypothetical protein